MSDFDPRNLVTWLAVAVCLAFALVLRRVGERGSSARKLALLLVVEAVTLATSMSVTFGEDLASCCIDGDFNRPRSLYVWNQLLHDLGDLSLFVLYPQFLASALKTPLLAPFARPSVRIALFAVAALLFMAARVDYWRTAPLIWAAMALALAFALVASLNAWLRAPSALARARALSFALAFGVRDLPWFALYAWFAVKFFSLVPGQVIYEQAPTWFLIYPLGSLLSVPLIAYGILKTHLFDLDLRVKWTLQRSTLAAIFVAIVYLVSETADRFFSAELGSVAGLLIAAGVVFFLAPLQRFAERVANAAMPNTQDTPAYAAFKKLQVYEAALAEAFGGDGVTAKERAMLARLRETLGIAAADADAIERDLTARVAVVADSRQGSAP